MAEKKRRDEISTLSFEDSIKQLREIVEKIEQGEIPLQDSLDQYEKGMTLIKHCRGVLQQAEKRIEKISKEEAAEEESTTEPGEQAPASGDSDAADEGLF